MKLTFARLREVLRYDPKTGVFTWRVSASPQRPAGSTAGCMSKRHSGKTYARIRIDGVLYYAHRLALFYLHGTWPTNTDHKNGSSEANHRANLREANQSQNLTNRGLLSRNTSGFKGVSKFRNGWRAQVGSSVHLGVFADPKKAARAYDSAARRLYGPFARTNKSLGLL